MSFTPFGPAYALQEQIGVAGTPLVNGTPTVLSWTAPADGQEHRAFVIATLHVTGAATGGALHVTGTTPDGTGAANPQMLPASEAVGVFQNIVTLIVASGSVVALVQTTALTAGAALLWAEIWGS